jgi:signal transduction histidine kinase
VKLLTDTTRQRVGYGVVAMMALLVVADIVVAVAQGSAATVLEDLVLGTAFGVVATISIHAQPRNSAVWTLLWAAFLGVLSQVGGNLASAFTDVTTTAIESGEVSVAPSSLDPLAALGHAIALTLWLPAVFLMAIHLLILFPNGEVSKRWRRILVVAAVMMAVAVAAGMARTGPWVDTPYDEIFGSDDLAFGLIGVVILPLMAIALAAVVQLIRRYRASSGEERLQFRWATWAFSIFVLNIFAFGWIPEPVGPVISTLALANIAISIGIAITRYRLYDIDIVVNRSLTFGALALFIGGVYVAIVVGVGELLGGGAGFGLSIVASVLVAMVFQPVRRRVEQRANRLVYGERATPYEVLVRFSRRSAELSDEELLHRIPRLIVDGTGAAAATLWTRTAEGFRTASSWPEDSVRMDIGGLDQFADPEADLSVPVFHDGELLGGLSLVKAPGESISPTEASLLADLASGLGLALRNANLTGQLRAQVAELEASRERVLAAADAARRGLENTLDSGPQQQLVALKVKLGPTRKRAEQQGAMKTAGLLAQLEIDAGDAIKAVRDFAGGIYPPLLEAEGLTVAIGQQARKAPIPVTVHGDGLERYSREIEAAVYFSVLEALQNAVKYADAASATVTLGATNGSLTFEISDDGRGFDVAAAEAGAGLAGMKDRLDTVGGQVTIDSTPGSGTLVAGLVPIRPLARSQTLEPA